MIKKKLTDFISKYYLNGQGGNSVLINFNAGDTRNIFYGPDRSIVGFVVMKEGINLGNIGIFMTDVFKQLLGAFDEENDLDIRTISNTSGIVRSLRISSGRIEVNANTAEEAVIPPIDHSKLDLENLQPAAVPDFEISFVIDDAFMSNFKRYAAAANAKIFAVNVAGGVVEIIMNYSKNASNQVKYRLDDPIPSPDFTTCFNVPAFLEIFNACKGMAGNIRVSSKGLANVNFEDDDFICRYFPLQVVLQEN